MSVARDRALEQNGRDCFENTVYFGDAVWDWHASRSLDWRLVGLGSRIERLEELGVTYLFSDYTDAASVLRAIED